MVVVCVCVCVCVAAGLWLEYSVGMLCVVPQFLVTLPTACSAPKPTFVGSVMMDLSSVPMETAVSVPLPTPQREKG